SVALYSLTGMLTSPNEIAPFQMLRMATIIPSALATVYGWARGLGVGGGVRGCDRVRRRDRLAGRRCAPHGSYRRAQRPARHATRAVAAVRGRARPRRARIPVVTRGVAFAAAVRRAGDRRVEPRSDGAARGRGARRATGDPRVDRAARRHRRADVARV